MSVTLSMKEIPLDTLMNALVVALRRPTTPDNLKILMDLHENYCERFAQTIGAYTVAKMSDEQVKEACLTHAAALKVLVKRCHDVRRELTDVMGAPLTIKKEGKPEAWAEALRALIQQAKEATRDVPSIIQLSQKTWNYDPAEKDELKTQIDALFEQINFIYCCYVQGGKSLKSSTIKSYSKSAWLSSPFKPLPALQSEEFGPILNSKGELVYLGGSASLPTEPSKEAKKASEQEVTHDKPKESPAESLKS